MTGRFSQCDDTCTTDCGHQGAGQTKDCRCGHSFAKHLGYVGGRQDPCAGGTPGFCGCTGYAPVSTAAPSSGDTVERPFEGRCSAPGCWYTLPVVDGLVVSHSAPMTLDNCKGSRRPPLPVRDRAVQELIARCDNYREDLDQRCTGSLRFRWGQIEGVCDTCGGRCGIAVADWASVTARSTATVPDCGCEGTGIRRFDSDGYEACPVHLTATVPEVERPANQLDDHWDGGRDGGLRARVEALLEHIAWMADDWAEMGPGDQRNRELWAPLHRKADAVRDLIPGQEPR